MKRALKIPHRPELCARPNHQGIAVEHVGLVTCRVNYSLMIDVLTARRLIGMQESAHSAATAEVRLYPTPSEPPAMIRLAV